MVEPDPANFVDFILVVVIDLDYGTSSGVDDHLNRVFAIAEGATDLAQYRYLGGGSIVQVDYTQPDVKGFMGRQPPEATADWIVLAEPSICPDTRPQRHANRSCPDQIRLQPSKLANLRSR
ncbi:MAG: hypothetical protein R3C05_19550 [Pirellulaceae bacterium]